MDRHGILNAESRGRMELGCEVAQSVAADEVVFMGWQYREDSEVRISRAMQAEAEQRGLSAGLVTRCNELSRDTVGDAIFSAADYWPDLDGVDPVVVTSDYHADRTGRIFAGVWGRDIPVRSAATPQPEEKAATETASLRAFERTFEGVAPGDLPAFAKRLVTSHVLYSNQATPDRPSDPAVLDLALDADWPNC